MFTKIPQKRDRSQRLRREAGLEVTNKRKKKGIKNKLEYTVFKRKQEMT